MPWSIIIRVRFLKSKYLKFSYHSSSIWPDINEYCDTVLDNTFWIVGRVIKLIFGMIYGVLQKIVSFTVFDLCVFMCSHHLPLLRVGFSRHRIIHLNRLVLAIIGAEILNVREP